MVQQALRRTPVGLVILAATAAWGSSRNAGRLYTFPLGEVRTLSDFPGGPGRRAAGSKGRLLLVLFYNWF